jgi:hypothetical protein
MAALAGQQRRVNLHCQSTRAQHPHRHLAVQQSSRKGCCKLQAAPTVAPSVEAPVVEARTCPFSRVTAGFTAATVLRDAEQAAAELYRAQEVVTPGPPVFSLRSLLDVSKILFGGIHEAMLHFSNSYGPVCRHVITTLAAWDTRRCDARESVIST